jgi:hypothetical protein
MSNARELPILITSAIGVAADHTKIVDTAERTKWTLHAAHMWRQLHPKARIVLCDGSGVDLREQLSKEPTLTKDVEFIGFCNNFAQVRMYGKGRGEGEIISYALAHSAYLAEADSFCKCTAKLWVDNHQAFVSARRGPFAFDYYGKLLPIRLDTRYYVASKREFVATLREAYLLVDEVNGVDLESAYVKALSSTQIKDYLSSVVPLIRGLSGSMGVQYLPSRRHAILKGMRNKLARALFGKTLRH